MKEIFTSSISSTPRSSVDSQKVVTNLSGRRQKFAKRLFAALAMAGSTVLAGDMVQACALDSTGSCDRATNAHCLPMENTGGAGGSTSSETSSSTGSETSTGGAGGSTVSSSASSSVSSSASSSSSSSGTGGGTCMGTEINLQDMAEYEYAQYRGGCTDADRIADSLGGNFTTGDTTLCLEPGDKLVTQVHDNADNNAWQYHLNSGNYLNNVKKVHMLQTAPMDAATANLYCTDALTYTNVNATGDDQDPAADGYKYKADTDGVNIFRGTAN